MRQAQARGMEVSLGDECDGTRMSYCNANCLHRWADATLDDGYGDTAPMGSYLGEVSRRGALDGAGDVYEWTADWYCIYSADSSRGRRLRRSHEHQRRCLRSPSSLW
jgi:formylglycine-generating enzyme required for sulfatase activity